MSSVTRFEAVLVWAQAVAMSGMVLLGAILLHPLLVLGVPLAALLPFLLFLRPLTRYPPADARLIDAGVSLGHGWVLTDRGLTWLPRSQVADVAQSLPPIPIETRVSPEGVTLRAIQARPMLAPLRLWWRTFVVMAVVCAWPGVASLDANFASALAVEKGLTIATFLLGVGALSAVWMLPYAVLALILGWERTVEVRLFGRLLHAGAVKAEVHDPVVEFRYVDGVPELALAERDGTLAVRAPVPILMGLTDHLSRLPARPGTARDVPETLVRYRSEG